MLDNITIEAFKGLGHVELELAALSVLVGANGSGKTSVLEGIEGFLSCASARGVTDAMRLARDLGRPGRFSTHVGAGVRLEVVDREEQDWAVSVSHPPRLADVPSALDLGRKLPVALRCSPEPSQLARPSRLNPGHGSLLRADGYGLAAYLTSLRLEFPERHESLVDRLRRVVPSVRGVRSRVVHDEHRAGMDDRYEEPRPGGTVFELVYDFDQSLGIPQAAVSTGTLAATFLLAMADRVTEAPAFLLVDDVETGLHPAAQLELIQILSSLGKGDALQILVTTHSPYVVDAVAPSAVWVLGPGPDGYALARSLKDHPDAERSLQALTAGEFWGAVGEDWIGQADSA